MTKEKKEWIDNVFIVLLFGIYPFILTQAYYNVLQTKFCFMAIITIVYFIIISVYQSQQGDEKYSIIQVWKKATGVDKWIILFFVSNILSFLLSKYKYQALTGCTDGFNGLYAVMLYMILYMIGKTWSGSKKIFLRCIQLAMVGMILFALLQFMGLDMFYLLTNLRARNNYLSTLGNTSIYGMYLLLHFPIVCGAYITAENKLDKTLGAMACGFGSMGILCSNTDATYIGFAVILVSLVAFFLFNKTGIAKILEIFILIVVGAVCFHLVYTFCEAPRGLSSFGRILSSPQITASALIILLIGYTLLYYVKESERLFEKIRQACILIFFLVIIIGLGLLIWFSLFDRETSLGMLDSYLRFDGDWGTGRGNIWSYLVDIYITKYNFFEKLFGTGQATAVMHLFEYYREEMLYEWGYYVEDAHNVYLHYLVTVGFFGLITYVGVIVGNLCNALKGNAVVWKKILGVALLACLSADIISILQPITLPYLWFYFGLIQHKES